MWRKNVIPSDKKNSKSMPNSTEPQPSRLAHKYKFQSWQRSTNFKSIFSTPSAKWLVFAWVSSSKLNDHYCTFCIQQPTDFSIGVSKLVDPQKALLLLADRNWIEGRTLQLACPTERPAWCWSSSLEIFDSALESQNKLLLGIEKRSLRCCTYF